MSVYDADGVNLNNIAYDADGTLLTQAYDADGNPLFDGAVVVRIPDASSGTAAGYTFEVQDDSGDTYVMYELANFISESPNLQSCCYDPDREIFYRFDATDTVRVYDPSFNFVETITMQSRAGHNNDCVYLNGKVYMTTGTAIDLGVWVWDVVENTVTTLTVTGVDQPTNGAARILAGICSNPDDENILILVYQDYRSDNELYHASDDKWTIYFYDLTTGEATLQATYPWEHYAIQGAVAHDGILYTAINYQEDDMTSAGDYRGVLLQPVRMDTWQELPPLLSRAAVEPEGLNIYPFSDNTELMMGLGKYQTVSKIVLYTIPYALT